MAEGKKGFDVTLDNPMLNKYFITEGSVEAEHLKQNVVLLLRKAEMPHEDVLEKGRYSPENLYTCDPSPKMVAYISPEWNKSDQRQERLKNYIMKFAEEVGVAPDPDSIYEGLDGYLFGGAGFYVQKRPGVSGVMRVRYDILNAESLADLFVNRWRLKIWTAASTPTAPPHISRYVNRYGEDMHRMKTYPLNPEGLEKSLNIYSNGAFDYEVVVPDLDEGGTEVGTEWDITDYELFDELENS
ncbi:hypothetical protein ACFL96_06005 [Thermoproteota archaeon]